jgi:hypothetical protein
MAEKFPPERPNDPRKVDDGSARPAIVRAEGGTPSERYLAKLGDRSFLNLWSYPNVFIDRKPDGKGDGKELCDLLVVCGDHVLIFSDKTIAWPKGDEDLAWKRWYKRAIHKSAAQIRGAERWIAQFPERIFIDRACTQQLPIELPPPERRKVHGIVVALGAGKACRSYFGEGIGSLMISPDIKGNDHFEGDKIQPFRIGDVDPDGSFIHVLDDASLDIVMGELDTITDFTSYLAKKEALIRSGRLVTAAGEEELVAQFMTRMNAEGEHDFTKPDGKPWKDGDRIGYGVGFYEELRRNPQYLAKKKADEVSYIWDRLIEAFTVHMMAGTSIVPNGQDLKLSDQEIAMRHMALVNRFTRRMYGAGILEVLEKGQTTDRFMRAFLPKNTETDTGFFFMTLKIPAIELAKGYQQYRAVRGSMLEAYALTLLEKTPQIKRIIGIGTEPSSTGTEKHGASEDLIYAEQPTWTDDFRKRLEERRNAFNIGENTKQHDAHGDEFPAVQLSRSLASPIMSGLNRRERRRLQAEARRRSRKGY